MKSFIRNAAVCAFLSTSFLSSCNKEIQQPISAEKVQSTNTATSACKATIFATNEFNTGVWNTIVQKWYGGEKILYIKTHFSGGLAGALYHTEPMLNIDWGEVTYEGDQVRVRDVEKNRLVFRATVQDNKPVATYLYNYTDDANGSLFIDTSYYYYAGDRLDYIIQLFETRYNGAQSRSGWEKFSFVYNPSGTLAYYSTKNEETTVEFRYWSTTNASYSDYTLTTAFRMLEYLDLTNLISKTTVSEIRMTRLHNPYPPFLYYDKTFYNFSITNGLVGYYLTPLGSGRLDYYTGWDCSGTAASSIPSQNNRISSLTQVKALY